METPARILVVDDEASIKLLVGKVLQAQGWQIDYAANGEEAIKLVGSATYSAVVLDKNLPGMSGLEVLDKLKKSVPDTEVIMMTAHADMESALQALGAGVYDYLVKPFASLDEVAHTVRRALEKRRMRLENQRLIDDLRVANDKLKHLNEGLEEMVARRTQQLEELTLTDDVTGLYNQRFLHRRLEEEYQRALRYGRALSLVMMDIDCFKLVNDNQGHIFGSDVLRRLGAILLQGVRDVDVVIRYGGDEFVVILPETDARGATVAAVRLRHAVVETDVGEPGCPFHVTVSMGLASRGACDAVGGLSLLQAADRALYAAKRNGRNCIYQMLSSEPRRVE